MLVKMLFIYNNNNNMHLSLFLIMTGCHNEEIGLRKFVLNNYFSLSLNSLINNNYSKDDDDDWQLQ